MRKLTVGLIIVLIVALSFGAMVNAKVLSPTPGGVPFFSGVFFPGLTVPPLSSPLTLPTITACSGPAKLILSAVEQKALRNLNVDKWVVVRFCFPAAFAGQKLVWSSSNPAVATAEGQGNWGLVLARGTGKATITASIPGGAFSYSFQVVVK